MFSYIYVLYPENSGTVQKCAMPLDTYTDWYQSVEIASPNIYPLNTSVTIRAFTLHIRDNKSGEQCTDSYNLLKSF